MADRFDLEQQILGCWNIVDDINSTIQYIEKTSNLSPRELIVLLRGISSLYRIKFENCFETFSTVISEKGFISRES